MSNRYISNKMDLASQKALQTSITDLLTLSYKDYAKTQADILSTLDSLATKSEEYTKSSEFENAIMQYQRVLPHIKTSPNQTKAEGYFRAIQDNQLTFESDQFIQQSLANTEDRIDKLASQHQTAEVLNVLNALKTGVAQYKPTATKETNEKLQAYLDNVDNLVNLSSSSGLISVSADFRNNALYILL